MIFGRIFLETKWGFESSEAIALVHCSEEKSNNPPVGNNPINLNNVISGGSFAFNHQRPRTLVLN